MNTHTNCLVCNTSSLTDLVQYSDAYLCRCDACGFVFSKRIPSQEELEKHYQGYGRNDYLSPITIKRYHEILDTFEQYRKTNKIIDVGCGIGYFLVEARKRGWDVYGTEYTDTAITINESKGISMKKGALDIGNYERGSFDIVTSFEVLEHINNPQEEIAKFNHLLRSGGLLYFTTPNFNATERIFLKNKWNVITYPEHLSYYTKKTMHKLLVSLGFDKISLQTTGISITRVQTSKGVSKDRYIQSDNSDDKLRNLTEDKWWAKLAKKLINIALDLFSLGNSLKGYYIKK